MNKILIGRHGLTAKIILLASILLVDVDVIWAFDFVSLAPATVSDPDIKSAISGDLDVISENQGVPTQESPQVQEDLKKRTVPVKTLSPNQRISQSTLQKFESALDRRKISEVKVAAQFDKIKIDATLPQDKLHVNDHLGGVFLQAPHNLADKYTGSIVKKIAKSTDVVDSIFINQRHRREFDYSRQSPSILVDLSLAYLQRTEHGTVVQIHGFAQEKRKSAKAKNTHFIVSSGHKGPVQLPSVFCECLKSNGFSGVHVFGKNFDELGATQNVVKRALYDHQFHRFLHIEISLPQRLALINSSDERARFSECLAALRVNSRV